MTTTALPARLVYPRPPIAVSASDLFREPAYQDGQPYDQDDDEDTDD